jgi:hypothetical protein
MQREVVQQRIFVGHVIVVSRQNVRWVIALQPRKVWHLVTVEVQNVIHRVALLHEELGTVEVSEERL